MAAIWNEATHVEIGASHKKKKKKGYCTEVYRQQDVIWDTASEKD